MVTQNLYANDAAGDLDLGANQTTGDFHFGVIQTTGQIDIGANTARSGAINIGTGAGATHTTTLGNVGQTSSITKIDAGSIALVSHGTTLALTAASTAALSGNIVTVDATSGNLAMTSTGIGSLQGASASVTGDTTTAVVSATTKATVEGADVDIDASAGNVAITATGIASTDAASITLESSAGNMTLDTDVGSSVQIHSFNMRRLTGTQVLTLGIAGGANCTGGFSTCRYWKWGPWVQINCSMYWTAKAAGSGNVRIKGLPFSFPNESYGNVQGTMNRWNWCAASGTNFVVPEGVSNTNEIAFTLNYSSNVNMTSVSNTSAFECTICFMASS